MATYCTSTIFNINYSLTYTEILNPCQTPNEKKYHQIIGIKFVLKKTKAKKNQDININYEY